MKECQEKSSLGCMRTHGHIIWLLLERSKRMLIIKATFPDGNEQNFGKPEDLRRYMKEEGYVEAHINAQFIYDVFVNMRMTADEIERWIDMKTENFESLSKD